MKGRDSGLEGFRTKGIQERRDTGKEGNRKEGFRTEGMRNRRDAGDINKRRDAHLVRHCSFVLFRLLNVLFCEIGKYQTKFRIIKPVSQNTKFRETRSIFS